MAVQAKRVEVWAAPIEDKPGAAAAKLEALAAARADLELVYAGRSAEIPDGGIMVVTPLRGAAQIKAAKNAGFCKSEYFHFVRVAGPDKAGKGAVLTRALADAGINMAGMSTSVIGKTFVSYMMFDSVADAARAVRALKKR